MSRRLLAVPLAVLLLGGAAIAMDVAGLNLGFETGDLTGWEYDVGTDGSAEVVTEDYGLIAVDVVVAPMEGDYFTVLKTGEGYVPTRLWQTLYVNAGETVSGWARFLTRDDLPYNDHAEVWIRAGDEEGPVVATLFEESVATVGYWGATDWTFFSHTFEQAGTYVLEGRVTNDQDWFNESYLCLDVLGGLSASPSSPAAPADSVDLEVVMDVKPGSDSNPVNRKSKGTLPVAIYGSSAVDVGTIDVASLLLGPGQAEPCFDDGRYEDVDGDGFVDLKLHFRVPDLGLAEADTSIELTGSFLDGVPFQTSDVVQVK